MFFQESEQLTEQNVNLKEEISKLEAEKNKLVSILRSHEPGCQRKLLDSSCYSGAADPSYMDPIPSCHQQQQIEHPMLPEFTSPPARDTLDVSDASLVPALKLESFDESPSYESHYYTNDNPQEPGTFLGVRTIGMTYLDLDSRCIAL